MSESLAGGRELLNLIETLGELEWAKFESRAPTIRIEGYEKTEDRSTHPPFTSFRFRNEKPELVQALIEATRSYSGEVAWVMIAHHRAPLSGTNWTICPKLVEESREEVLSLGLPIWRYFKERKPSFGPIAYRDMLGLARHLRDRLTASGFVGV